MSSDATAGSRVATTAARLPGTAAAAVAVALAALATAACLVGVLLPVLTGGDWLLTLFRTPEPVVAPSFALVGALLVRRPAARRLGWLLLVVAVSAGAYVLAVSAARGLGDDGVAGWARTWVWLPALLLTTTLLPQVLPHGRSLPGWWRVPAWASVAVTAVTTVVVAVTGAQPFASPVFVAALGALLLASAASVTVRVRRADGVQRRQLAWVAYGVGVAVVATFLAPWWVVCVAVLAVPAGLLVAVTRYRLYDIDRLVNRTVVGAVLLVLTAVAYAALVAWVGALLDDRPGVAPVLATFLVALSFHPTYVRVQRGVDRLVHGRPGDPYALLGRVQRALATGASPRDALQAGLDEVRRGLRLTGAVVSVPLADDVVEVVAGSSPDRDAQRLPLLLHGRVVGTLCLPVDDDLRGRRRLINDLVGPLAAGAYAVRAAADLERSRTALVAAREDERRRLRRDLHDGLGPQLAAVVMTVDTARSALGRGDAARAGTLLDGAAGRAGEAVQDVRRLVHGLRPPALDDLGLLGALQAGAAALSDGGGPPVQVRGCGDLGVLPAAAEVAVLRIAQEALHNAVRHAGARLVTLEVSVRTDGEQAVHVVVDDDGTGMPGTLVAGVGLASMRERAAELGGQVQVGARPGGAHGTRVHAVLPLEHVVVTR